MATRTITLKLSAELAERLEKAGVLENTDWLTQVLEEKLHRQEEIARSHNEPTTEAIQDEISQQFQKFLAYRKQTHPHLSEQGQRQLAGMDLINANHEAGDDEFWDRVDEFIKENRFNLSTRKLDFDNE